MARHRKLAAADEENPQLDISSLIDCCFLLLIYFLVATTIVKENSLEMEMPGSPKASSGPTKLAPSIVKIDAAGTITWGKDEAVIDTDMNNHDLPTLVTELETYKNSAESADSKPVVQLYVDAECPHQRVIDVINALTRAQIRTVALTNIMDD